MPRVVGGIIQLKINGEVFPAKGDFDCNLGRPMNEAVIGADSVHGYKSTPQVPFIEGEITDQGALDINALVTITDATITIGLANGKTFALRDAWFAGEGTVNTGEGNIAVRFEGMSAEEF
jgi:hypothetical protein